MYVYFEMRRIMLRKQSTESESDYQKQHLAAFLSSHLAYSECLSFVCSLWILISCMWYTKRTHLFAVSSFLIIYCLFLSVSLLPSFSLCPMMLCASASWFQIKRLSVLLCHVLLMAEGEKELGTLWRRKTPGLWQPPPCLVFSPFLFFPFHDIQKLLRVQGTRQASKRVRAGAGLKEIGSHTQKGVSGSLSCCHLLLLLFFKRKN